MSTKLKSDNLKIVLKITYKRLKPTENETLNLYLSYLIQQLYGTYTVLHSV